jgi:hypothetical protein
VKDKYSSNEFEAQSCEALQRQIAERKKAENDELKLYLDMSQEAQKEKKEWMAQQRFSLGGLQKERSEETTKN